MRFRISSVWTPGTARTTACASPTSACWASTRLEPCLSLWTGNEVDRGNLGLSRAIGGARLGLSLVTYRDLQKWGTPLPFDAGEPLPGFETDRNYAVGGAALEHRVSGVSSQASVPLRTSLRLENTVALTRDPPRALPS